MNIKKIISFFKGVKKELIEALTKPLWFWLMMIAISVLVFIGIVFYTN